MKWLDRAEKQKLKIAKTSRVENDDSKLGNDKQNWNPIVGQAMTVPCTMYTIRTTRI